MPDETPQPTTKSAPKAGLDTPFAKNAFPNGVPEGVDEETRLFHGIDPETKERLAVTVEGLKAEFGEALGEKKYVQIAGLAGGSFFFNPHLEASNYRPPLGIMDLPEKYKTEVAGILAAKE